MTASLGSVEETIKCATHGLVKRFVYPSRKQVSSASALVFPLLAAIQKSKGLLLYWDTVSQDCGPVFAVL